MLVFLENHDSFSHLLADIIGRLGASSIMVDTYEPYQSIHWQDFEGIVIGPGPGNEQSSPNLMRYVGDAVQSGLPILGVCLGMQALGVYFGAALGHAQEPIHGKIRVLQPVPESTMYPSNKNEKIVRYHSLVLNKLPKQLRVEATSPEGECMALSHKQLPIWGVQYHPEAACAEAGPELLQRWLRFAGIGTPSLPLQASKSALPLRYQTLLDLKTFTC